MLQPCHGDPCTARSSHRTLRRLGGTVKRHVHWLQDGCGGGGSGGLFSKFVSISYLALQHQSSSGILYNSASVHL